MDDEALAYLAITRLQNAYADVATRQAWSDFPPLAIPDARFSFNVQSGDVIEVVGTDAFCEFGAKSIDRFSFYEYIPLNTVVAISSDGTASGRSYALEVGEERESGEWINVFGHYYDDYVVFDGTWRFARRQYQTFGQRRGEHLVAFPLGDRLP